MNGYFHSVRLKEKRCRGCVNCTKRCPTEAIRVHNGKAQIIESRCIDCGECIRHCLHRAKAAYADDLDVLEQYKYRVALPAPSLYAQFSPDIACEQITDALKTLGFDDVFDVAKAAEILTVATRELLKNPHIPRPIISSACPAVVRLIQVRFPELIEHLLPLDAPIEVAARIAREEALQRTSYQPEDIGVFFITPCPAKVTAIKQPVGGQASEINGAIALNKVYYHILKQLPKQNRDTQATFRTGLGWALAGGESVDIAPERRLVVSDIHHVSEVFDAIFLGKLKDIDFVECLACAGGCIGGPLTVESRFTAELNLKKRIMRLSKQSELTQAHMWYSQGFVQPIEIPAIESNQLLQLDDDIEEALVKVELLEKTLNSLPGFDCGSCGSPNCKSLAEDIVKGQATLTDCIFKLRERVQNLAEEIVDLAHKLPPVMSRDLTEDGGEDK